MTSIELNSALLEELRDKTVIVTGAAGGIGAETVRLFNTHGANVVVADLERTRSSAEALIASLPAPTRARFGPVDITNWVQMKQLFRQAVDEFGSVDVVVANAGVMESASVLDTPPTPDGGSDDDLEEPSEAYRVIDINLKGTLNSEYRFYGPNSLSYRKNN